jgi:nucleotide-binding universal stress UspA family protein
MTLNSVRRPAPTTGTVEGALAHDTILVGFSHSAASAAALRWALREGRRQGCGVTVLHVADPAERADERADERMNRTGSAGLDAGPFLDRVSALLDEEHEAVPVRVAHQQGTVEELLRHAATGARVLVLGRPEHCRHEGLDERLKASVRCPVVVIAAAQHSPGRSLPRQRH